MSKKINNLKWETVALEGFPMNMTESLHGFVGLEECTSYGLDKESNKSKKNQQKKRKITEKENKAVPNKLVKLSNGFVVESCINVTPSITNKVSTKNQDNNDNKKKKKRRNSKKKNKSKNKDNEQQTEEQKPDKSIVNGKNKSKLQCKPKLGEDISQTVSDLTEEDMLTWAEFKLPDPILKALMELGFKQPTKIQQMTLPAAIHGRRDILGAAETGSGKTLAFGLPILSGIIKIKEKAKDKGLDVYDIAYKKSSAKRKNLAPKEDVSDVKSRNKKNKKFNNNKNKEEAKPKESSEDGYSTGDEDAIESADEDKSDDEKAKSADEDKSDDEGAQSDDYIEEYEVPVKKRAASVDEGNDSDNSDNYIHLSDMLDSDDLADSSDKENDESGEVENESDQGANESDNDSEETDQNGSDNEEDEEIEENYEFEGLEGVEEDDKQKDEEVDDDDDVLESNKRGSTCVKVIDNIEFPRLTVVKTGKPLYALIVTPTRELAIQISRHLIAAAKYTGIRVATIVGGMAAVKQERVLRCGPEVVVATPGRLWELIGQGQPHLQQLETVKFLAIDETDRMVERGHFEELQPLLERLNGDDKTRASRQNFVFSATLTMVHDLPTHMKGKKVTKRGKIINRKIEKMTPQQKIKRLVDMVGMSDPKVVDITTPLGTAETLTECIISCEFEQKDAYLYYVLRRHPGRTIVFCNSIGSVKRLAQLLTLLKCRPLPLHASMPQRQRLKNLERFRDDPQGVLIATDVAARGLDIPNVDHVIQYQVPRTAENYVHRSGRTARATKEGLALLMVAPAEAAVWHKLCRTLNKTTSLPSFPVSGPQLGVLREAVSAARALDELELRRKRAAQSRSWRDRAAREMDIIVDDDDVPVKEIDPSIDKALRAKRRQLDSLLSRPVLPQGFSFKYPTLNEPAALLTTQDNALQVMKKALESGELKKEKRKSKNAPLLKLQKLFKPKPVKKPNKK